MEYAELSKEESNLLSRIDERTQFLVTEFGQFKQELKDLNNKYVQKEEFTPVKTIVYGLVGMICIAVIGALVTLVVS